LLPQTENEAQTPSLQLLQLGTRTPNNKEHQGEENRVWSIHYHDDAAVVDVEEALDPDERYGTVRPKGSLDEF